MRGSKTGFARSISENREDIIKGTGSYLKRAAGFYSMMRLQLPGWTHIITTDEVM